MRWRTGLLLSADAKRSLLVFGRLSWLDWKKPQIMNDVCHGHKIRRHTGADQSAIPFTDPYTTIDMRCVAVLGTLKNQIKAVK